MKIVTTMQEESKYLNNFFEFLNKKNVRYCVMNNYKEYPNVIPSDVDFSIENSTFTQLDEFLIEFSKQEKLPIIQKIWHGYNKCAYILSPLYLKGRFRLQLDFFVDFTAKGYYKLISSEEMVATAKQYKNFFIPSSVVEMVFLIMRRIIKDDADNDKLNEIRKIYSQGNNLIVEIRSVFGKTIANLCRELIETKDYAEWHLNNHVYKNTLKSYAKARSSYHYRFVYRFSEIKRLFYRIRYPVGLSICFLSPDGGGKSTIIKKVTELTAGSFHGDVQLYWRPGLLPPMGRLKFWKPWQESTVNPDPHGHASQMPIKSALRFMYYLIDFIFGYCVKIWVPTLKKNVVLIDRYYYDFLVDLHRYRMSLPLWVPRILLRFIPCPDIVIVLSCPSKVMIERKQELTIEELERQSNEYRKLSNLQPNAFLVNSDQDIYEVGAEVTQIILDKKRDITAKSMNCLTASRTQSFT